MKIFAVIDTNVVVSALLTHNPQSPTISLLEKVRDGKVVPMINDDIISEYMEVLSRTKFGFNPDDATELRLLFLSRGVTSLPESSTMDFIDPDDLIFYDTYLTRDDAYLVTGNLKHYPSEPRILSPADMIHIIKLSDCTMTNVLSEPLYEYISSEKESRIQRAWEAIERCRKNALANGTADMSMEEIDEEIRQFRAGRSSYR